MITEANKSIKPESDFHKLLLKAFQRAHVSANIAKELDVSRNLVNCWLAKPFCTPHKVEEHSKKLQDYLDKPYISGHNPCKRQRMWQSMRCLGIFKTKTIAAIAETTDNNTWQYISGLTKAGYIVLAGKQSYTHIWKLVKNTGPKAPEVSRLKDSLYDHNLGLEVWRKGPTTI